MVFICISVNMRYECDYCKWKTKKYEYSELYYHILKKHLNIWIEEQKEKYHVSENTAMIWIMDMAHGKPI